MPAETFHAGEYAVQARAGVRALASRVGGSIRSTMPPLARAFLEDRRSVVLGALDARGRPWASLVSGPLGFVRTTDERTLRLASTLPPGDPLEDGLRPGALAGILALDAATRRRLRLNGRIASADAHGIVIAADQVYSNCPKYIQRREDDTTGEPFRSAPARRSPELSERQRAWVRAADTFFIVSANPGEGVDASHRGGMPGFVRVEGRRLVWPDYAGNAMFNTLGNIEVYPHAGLLVPDYATGATLHLTGRAALDWTPAHRSQFPGAERLVTLDVEEVVELAANLPSRMTLREYSPFNPREE